MEARREKRSRSGKKSVVRAQNVGGAWNHLINTSAAQARLPFRPDCIANKTQVVSAGGEEESEASRGRKEESSERRAVRGGRGRRWRSVE